MTVKKIYDKLGKEGLARLTNEKFTKNTLVFIKKYVSKKDKILDLACGYGRIALPLLDEGYDVRGIDVSKKLIKRIGKKGFIVGDIRKLPYPDESFDCVLFLWSSFNHFVNKRDQIKVLKEIKRVLKNKGCCVIDLFHYNSKQILELEKKGELSRNILKFRINNETVPLFLFSKEYLRSLFKVAGFKKYRLILKKNFEREGYCRLEAVLFK